MDGILEGRYAGRRAEADWRRNTGVLSWNIQRGANLPGVMELIRRQNPDICIFQEVDVHAKRTGRLNVADVIAAQFAFNYVFGVEFEELSQGSAPQPAFQGQAVFARCRLAAPRILRFRRQSDIWRPRWYLPQWQAFQPRLGGRMALVVELVLGRTPLVVYDVHLESRADDGLRLWQLSEVVQDSCRYPANTPVVIVGDLNSRIAPSPLEQYLHAAGFRDACEGHRCGGTKPDGRRLDWIFMRGPASCFETRVHRDTTASDHYPLSTNLILEHRERLP